MRGAGAGLAGAVWALSLLMLAGACSDDDAGSDGEGGDAATTRDATALDSARENDGDAARDVASDEARDVTDASDAAETGDGAADADAAPPPDAGS